MGSFLIDEKLLHIKLQNYIASKSSSGNQET